jgi:hypothetical protein
VIEALATPGRRRVTVVLLSLCVVAAIAASRIGLDGNTAANALAFGPGAALVLAAAHPWRDPRRFRYLFCASGLGFAVFVILHNAFAAVAEAAANVPPLRAIAHALSVAAFMAAVFLCPAGLVLGLGGLLLMSWKSRGSSQPGSSGNPGQSASRP